MLQVLPLGGLAQAEGELLLQQLGLVQQQQALPPVVLQPVSQVQGTPTVVIPTPDPVDSTYVFTQSTVSTLWDINHNLGQFPAVITTDPNGSVILGEVLYVSSNEVTVSFSQPVSGVAYLNV